MRVDAYASEPQYLEHLVPIWLALGPEERGKVTVPRSLLAKAQSLGVPISALTSGRPRRGGGPILVAAHQDYRAALPRAVVYVEHGAGQSYDGELAVRHPSYSGGVQRDQVALFVVPNERVAAKNERAYPDIPNVVVGDAPKLDPWRIESAFGREKTGNVTIAVSFHPDVAPLSRTIPETRSAWPYYDAVLPALVEHEGWTILGHGHPRSWARLSRRWQSLHVECVPDFDEVLLRADVLVCDNSSALYEFASTDRPVVVLNAPWYRREVEHGLRFWEDCMVGVNCESPALLVESIALALEDPPIWSQNRREVTERVYPQRDGAASSRAVVAIRDILPTIETQEARAMPNPYAARRSKTAVVDAAIFPAGRLRRLGATQEEIALAKAEFDGYEPNERSEALDAFALLTDDEVRADIANLRAEQSVPAEGAMPADVIETVEAVGAIALEDVPDGTKAEVLAWVARDPERAAAALLVEQSRAKPRKTLLAELEARSEV